MFDRMTFTDAGLMLGRVAIISFGKKVSVHQPGDNAKDVTIITLLTAAFGQPVMGGWTDTLRRATKLWQSGDKGLAQIHLSLMDLPRINEDSAYRLSLAKEALEKGISPSRVLKHLGCHETALDLDKRYNPDQPRVSAGSGAESGRWTSGGEANTSNSTKRVRRVDIRITGAVRSDANPSHLVSGVQVAQVNPRPVIPARTMKHITDLHGVGTPDETKGKFTAEYSTETAIRQLVDDAWKQATPADIGAGRWGNGRAAIAAEVLDVIDGVPQPHIIGVSGARKSAPSIPTNTYIVVLDSDNNVITTYPINPADTINPRDE